MRVLAVLLLGLAWLLLWVGVLFPLWVLRLCVTGAVAVRRGRVAT